jgi:hypothetical protein
MHGSASLKCQTNGACVMTNNYCVNDEQCLGNSKCNVTASACVPAKSDGTGTLNDKAMWAAILMVLSLMIVVFVVGRYYRRTGKCNKEEPAKDDTSKSRDQETDKRSIVSVLPPYSESTLPQYSHDERPQESGQSNPPDCHSEREPRDEN